MDFILLKNINNVLQLKVVFLNQYFINSLKALLCCFSPLHWSLSAKRFTLVNESIKAANG